jgi:hypothetical protein
MLRAVRPTIKMNSPILPTSAECALLLRCCATWDPFADSVALSELIERGVDWDRFLALANRNGVAPLVAARLGAEGVAKPPAHVARALSLGYEINALRCNHLAGCAAEIVDAFASSLVPVIAIKGPALALSAYGDVAMRVFGDLDFMVRSEDLPRAVAALERLGYSSPAYRADVVESGFFPDVSLDFSGPDGVVDLHWRLSANYFPFAPTGEQIWKRTGEIDLLGRRVCILGPVDSILFQACHGSKHGWMTLAQVCDFARLLATPGPMSWSSLLDEARRMRASRMLLLGVDLANSLSLCEVPGELLDAAGGDSHIAALSRRVQRGIFDARRAVARDEWLIALGTIESARERIRYLVQRVARPKMSDRSLMPLPRSLFPLYYIARPLLVAIKHRRTDAPTD